MGNDKDYLPQPFTDIMDCDDLSKLYLGPAISIENAIRSGIKSSKFDPSTSRRFESQRPGELVAQGKIYFAEIQRKIGDSDKFLAVFEAKAENGERYVKWITNDEEYALTHPNAFDHRVARVDFVYGLRAKDKKGRTIQF